MLLANKLREVAEMLKNIKMNHMEVKPTNDNLRLMLNQASEVLDLGSNLFEKFCEAGCEAAKQEINSFKNLKNQEEIKSIVNEIADLIVDTEFWLHRFLFAYPGLFINIDDGEFVSIDQCEVRSGFQFMLDLFKDLNSNLDCALENLEKRSRDKFDSTLDLAKKYTEFRVNAEDVPECIPAHHKWWFPLSDQEKNDI